MNTTNWKTWTRISSILPITSLKKFKNGLTVLRIISDQEKEEIEKNKKEVLVPTDNIAPGDVIDTQIDNQ